MDKTRLAEDRSVKEWHSHADRQAGDSTGMGMTS